jgi:phosphoglucosamine mutase
MNTKLFGTDGIRARAGEFPLNAPTIVVMGQAIGEVLGGELLLGEDTRESSPWIRNLLKEGVRRTAATVRDAGVIPTPAVALLTKHDRYSGGVMISASHNPFDDNGIKVFAPDGTKVDDDAEARIESRILDLLPPGAREQRDAVPESTVSAANATGAPEHYLELLASHFPQRAWLSGMSVLMDCSNGAMSIVAPSILRSLGAEVRVIHAEPSGKNINAGCGAVHLDALMGAMKSSRADFGVAFDGDGDRSMFVSGAGRRIDGDAVLLIMARRLKHAGRLDPAIVVGTSMTNYALEKKLQAEGINLTRVAVGDRFVFEEMLRSGSVLGGEPAGHVIFSDFRISGDALLTTLKVAEAIVEERASLDDLTRDWVEAPQLLKGVRVKQKAPLESLPAVQKKIAQVDEALKGCGRIVVRYSGTEPLLRVMIESDDASRNDDLMEDLLATIREHIEIA